MVAIMLLGTASKIINVTFVTCMRFHTNNVRTVHGSPYTFSVKPKWRTVVLWFFAARSSAEAYFRSSPPRGHSTIGFPMRCEGFVAIWLRAREDIAHNRFQLLFIGASLSEPHTYVKYATAVCMCIYMYICAVRRLRPRDQLMPGAKWTRWPPFA